MGGSGCPSCRLKYVALVRQVNVPVLVAGNDTLWTRAVLISMVSVYRRQFNLRVPLTNPTIQDVQMNVVLVCDPALSC